MRARGAELANSEDVDRLARSFLPVDDTVAANYLFPRHFEPREATRSNPAFPFGAGSTRDGPVDARVAIVHADISGLGQLFRKISLEANSVEDVRSVAEAIEGAVGRAARRASEACLLPFAAAPGMPRA